MQRHPWCQQLKVGYGATAKNHISRPVLQEDCEQHETQGTDMGLAVSKRPVVHERAEEDCAKFSKPHESEVVQYLGIAADEKIRVERHKDKDGISLPLVEAGWTEQMCREWCEENGLLSPIYTTATRGGCWFCHNQPIGQLRILRHDYPELWALLLKWDNDSPVTFRADGRTVHDIDRRLRWEDEGYKPNGKVFRWSDLDEAQMNIFQFIGGKDEVSETDDEVGGTGADGVSP